MDNDIHLFYFYVNNQKNVIYECKNKSIYLQHIDNSCVPPPAELVRIRGLSFELGDELSPQAASHLVAAIAQVKVWCQQRAYIP